MQGPYPYSMLKSLTLLTLLFGGQVVARPGLSPEFYTIINGKESFLSVVLEQTIAGSNNQGGPAVTVGAVNVVTVTNPPEYRTITTTCSTSIGVVVTVNVPGVTRTSTRAAGAAAASSLVINPLVVYNTVVASTPIAAQVTIVATTQAVVQATSQNQNINAAASSKAAGVAIGQAANGGIFIQQSEAVTVALAGTTLTTAIAVPTTSVSIVQPIAAHTVIPTVATNPNLPCSGDLSVIAAFEKANVGKPIDFQIKNSCPYSIWPEMSYYEWPGSSSITTFDVGKLEAYSGAYTWTGSPYWMTSARMWAKEGCDSTGENCAVDAGNAPTLFEWTIYPDALQSCATELNYDISLVDGHTIPIGVTFDSPACPSRTCTASKTINGTCPNVDLNKVNGAVQGCLSSCAYLQSIGINSGDAFELACCIGAHNTAATCPPSSGWFAAACPEAYSYAYDDVAANRACTLPGVMLIEYCPYGSVP